MDEIEENGSENSEPREMHKAVCSECGVECEVPFKPIEGKNVRCEDCFRKFRARRPRRDFRRRFSDMPREMHKAICADCSKECEVPFKPVEGKPVLCTDCFRIKRGNRQETEF